MARGLKRRSLRTVVFTIALAVIGSPLLVLIGTNWVEAAFGDRTLHRAERSAAAVGENLESIDAEALRRDQLIRVIALDGQPVRVADHWVNDTWLLRLGDVFYGPGRRQSQLDWEHAQPPLLNRPEVIEALATGRGQQCEVVVVGNLSVCATAVKVGSRIIHVQGSSRRAVQTLYQSRRQLTKLVGFTLCLGLILAWWLSSSVVGPVEKLRREMLERATQAVPRAGIDLGRRDELGDLADAFNSVMTALAQRTQATEVFLADLVHELKNPVAAIRAAAERLPETKPDDVERLKTLSLALNHSALRLEQVLTELLELSRAEAGLPNEPRERLDLTAYIEGLCASLRADARYVGVSVQVHATGPIEISAVPHRLETALRNVLENAASFAGPAGWVRAEVTPSFIRISDSGPGIAAEVLPNVFDRFFTTRGSQRGTGLGLAMARAIIEAHGARIIAESPEGHGAVLTITGLAH